MSNSTNAVVPLPAGCPPDDAVSASMMAYRLAQPSHAVGSRTVDDDWVIPYMKRKGECAGKPDVCECHAHSMFLKLDYLVEASKLSSWIRGKSIAAVEIGPADGVTKDTPIDIAEGHFEWWAPQGFVPLGEIVMEGNR